MRTLPLCHLRSGSTNICVKWFPRKIFIWSYQKMCRWGENNNTMLSHSHACLMTSTLVPNRPVIHNLYIPHHKTPLELLFLFIPHSLKTSNWDSQTPNHQIQPPSTHGPCQHPSLRGLCGNAVKETITETGEILKKLVPSMCQFFSLFCRIHWIQLLTVV